ncbi:telomere repeat-binding protein 5-like [Actinidia eriantha]|uniref:telomere repeat-binding protein 5-like n=1 Tax=Actinidia eriantha TaxID=165200 RepID=UPI00258724A5|nr:telomere repeat-binding protein 5-like [Actinidia eriantha]XP_057480799.1 telomere repeat-binding protein 5-like [Actinidia eriantha]
MVLQNRLGYGFNGYQVPPTPRAARSARRRGSIRKRVDDNQICAFDLLATVAGKLLLEGQGSASSSNIQNRKEMCTIVEDSIKKEQQGADKASKIEFCDQGSCGIHHISKEFSHAHIDYCSGLASVITSSDGSDTVDSADKLVDGKNKNQPGNFASKVEVASSRCESFDGTIENENKEQIKMELPTTGNASNSTKADMCSLDDPAVRFRKSPALVNLDNSVTLPLGTDHVHSGSFPACRDDVNLVIRDDDENSSGCTLPSTMKKAFRPSPRIGDRRIRKLLASKYWKVTPKLKDGENFNADSETKPVYHNRKTCYKRQRSQRDYPIKKRILYDRVSLSNFDGGVSHEDISSSPRKGFSFGASGSAAMVHGAFGNSAGIARRHTPSQSRNSHVKLHIKSFKVPELFIEIPETATVGSLKRTVMEAVKTILGDGLRVGVLLQGKKIRDDNKTLLQTGISHDNKLDTLGFSLEPSPSQASPPLCHEDHPLLLTCDAPQPLTRYPPPPSGVHSAVQHSTADALSDPPFTNLGNCIESDHDSAPSPPDMSTNKSPVDSRALVSIPETNVEALAIVPMKKSKRSEAVQRRIRRPFSVSEVEALVQAVEKLGTGRWRDVKMQAFDNAKHRTYVDLKDKWKTLVHTARISVQQRRGEPVPQELLDRVLAAHAYWSQQQAKQQLKHQSETFLLL